jgi:hypothetical protein
MKYGQNYLNRNIKFIKNSAIYQYDMISAGLACAFEYQLIDEEKYNYLKSLPKKERQIKLGMLCRNNSEITKGIEYGIKDTMHEFISNNDITNSNIISIKRDGIFTLKKCNNLDITDVLKFREAESYSSYFNLFNKEFYYSNQNKTLTVKGITQSVVEYHQQYILKEIVKLINIAENNDYKTVIISCKNFKKKYLNLELEEESYREFNNNSKFRLMIDISGTNLFTDFFPGKKRINIGYNLNYINPLLGYLII